MSESSTKTIEQNELIAVRVPPGDKWRLVDDEKSVIYPTLTDALESYFDATHFSDDFRLSPRSGNLYAIRITEEIIVPKPVRKFNVYGEEI